MDSGVSLHSTISAYHDMTDEAVVALAKQGDDLAEEYIITKYKNNVRLKARGYFLVGADGEDIIQEGMIGLFKAIRDFDINKNSSFKAFAELCIKRQMITAITTATRQKHTPLNSYISLNKAMNDEDPERTLMDVLTSKRDTDPESLYISKEAIQSMKKSMDAILSSFEWKVLTGYLAGESYQEIATDLNRPLKSVDNALQRIKRKIEKNIKLDI